MTFNISSWMEKWEYVLKYPSSSSSSSSSCLPRLCRDEELGCGLAMSENSSLTATLWHVCVCVCVWACVRMSVRNHARKQHTLLLPSLHKHTRIVLPHCLKVTNCLGERWFVLFNLSLCFTKPELMCVWMRFRRVHTEFDQRSRQNMKLSKHVCTV